MTDINVEMDIVKQKLEQLQAKENARKEQQKVYRAKHKIVLASRPVDNVKDAILKQKKTDYMREYTIKNKDKVKQKKRDFTKLKKQITNDYEMLSHDELKQRVAELVKKF
tara:strand:- start:150 stop:479 length:330 start_codon:yes stop_codon:yes gene_type:complete